MKNVGLVICSCLFFSYTLKARSITEIWLPKVANGFSVSVYAEVDNARQLTVAEDGTVFVGSRSSGKVWAVRDKDADGYAEDKILLAESLNLPSGVRYYKGDLYIAEVHQILRFKNILSTLTKSPKFEVFFTELPDKSHHGWKFIDFDKEGNLWIPVGAPCNICNPDSTQFSHLRKLDLKTKKWTRMAIGIRNTVGFDWHPITGKLWFSDNGRDWMGDDKPADELNRIDHQGQHFGYPFVHGHSTQDPEFYANKPENLKITPPALEFQAHVAPLGIHFYRGKQFPKSFNNQLFVAQHGSWNRSSKVGFQVVLVTIEQDKVIATQPFLNGFLKQGKTLGRPVAFAELEDGSLLVSDDFGGKIYRIEYQGK